jgi:glycosyltransferase involved in cell wall biosynthesis
VRVSVCIPTFNQAAYLEQAIWSCCEQTLKPFEIIVYDDCSTDETQRILSKLSAKISCLKIFTQVKNVGISSNVNSCLRAATGDFVVRLDSDDFLAQLYIERLVELLAENPDAAYAHAAVQEVDRDGSFLRQRYLARKPGFQNNIDALKASAKGFKVAANILMFRRNSLEKVGYIASRVNFAEDYYLVASLAAAGCGNVYVNEILSYYRVWKDAGKVRQRRKLDEILGYRKLFEEILEPAYSQLHWKMYKLKRRRADFARRHTDCLSWDVYTHDEKLELKKELNNLSPAIRVKCFAWMHLNGFGKILGGYEQAKLSLKDKIKMIFLKENTA